ncbi:hypothetical protein B0H16DRAFT_1719784 [Mycena metata]|uniref:Uncharacterized protein n=1 Tax=Mycena metata TaxID=1033252 RepID=A0AAD7JDL1_9AGAR|nr:hypothetical protein B0H16DRAFT_1719784 [Mycena metata]
MGAGTQSTRPPARSTSGSLSGTFSAGYCFPSFTLSLVLIPVLQVFSYDYPLRFHDWEELLEHELWRTYVPFLFLAEFRQVFPKMIPNPNRLYNSALFPTFAIPKMPTIHYPIYPAVDYLIAFGFHNIPCYSHEPKGLDDDARWDTDDARVQGPPETNLPKLMASATAYKARRSC